MSNEGAIHDPAQIYEYLLNSVDRVLCDELRMTIAEHSADGVPVDQCLATVGFLLAMLLQQAAPNEANKAILIGQFVIRSTLRMSAGLAKEAEQAANAVKH